MRLGMGMAPALGVAPGRRKSFTPEHWYVVLDKPLDLSWAPGWFIWVESAGISGWAAVNRAASIGDSALYLDDVPGGPRISEIVASDSGALTLLGNLGVGDKSAKDFVSTVSPGSWTFLYPGLTGDIIWSFNDPLAATFGPGAYAVNAGGVRVLASSPLGPNTALGGAGCNFKQSASTIPIADMLGAWSFHVLARGDNFASGTAWCVYEWTRGGTPQGNMWESGATTDRYEFPNNTTGSGTASIARIGGTGWRLFSVVNTPAKNQMEFFTNGIVRNISAWHYGRQVSGTPWLSFSGNRTAQLPGNADRAIAQAAFIKGRAETPAQVLAQAKRCGVA